MSSTTQIMLAAFRESMKVAEEHPGYKCRTCGHKGKDFRGVVSESGFGSEFDAECPKCESTEAEEL